MKRRTMASAEIASTARRASRILALVAALFVPLEAAAEGPSLTRIAFGSCANEDKPQPIWDAVLQFRPELFLFLGDNVYGDVRGGRGLNEDELLQGLAEAYELARTIPGLSQLRASVPHLATWDDHDYGRNDGGADFAGRREAQKLFADFWDLAPSDPRRHRDGVYHAQTFGPPGQRVQVILLDTRFFRSPLKPTDLRGVPGRERYIPDDDPSKTMLGEVQWRWLEDRLREPAEIRLVVSSIQVLAEGHGWERWGNFPTQRQRLFDLIRATGANGVLFLSGDRHLGALYRETERVPYPLIEMTASGITESFPESREAGPNRMGDVYGRMNFGTLEIDWAGRSVALLLRGQDGEPVRRHALSFDELRPR